LKSIVFKYRKPRKEINFLWEEETLWLLQLNSVGQFTTLQYQEISAPNSV
jgi:hypothetical protein